MKDISLFTTEYGVASLALKEIPYRREAYIRIRDVQPGGLPELLAECVAFCRMAGAEKIYAADHKELEQYPIHAVIYEMRGDARIDWEKVEHLFPVTEQTVSQWREVCNECLANVDCAATLTAAEEKEIVSSGGAYFVHHNGEVLGIGWIKDGVLLVICAVVPGAGERVLHSLISTCEDEQIQLEVASTNRKAIRLYERSDFMITQEKVKWHRVF